MIRVGELLVCCDNLCSDDRVKLVGKNDKHIYKNVQECLEESEIKNLKVKYFYVYGDIGCVVTLREDL